MPIFSKIGQSVSELLSRRLHRVLLGLSYGVLECNSVIE